MIYSWAVRNRTRTEGSVLESSTAAGAADCSPSGAVGGWMVSTHDPGRAYWFWGHFRDHVLCSELLLLARGTLRLAGGKLVRLRRGCRSGRLREEARRCFFLERDEQPDHSGGNDAHARLQLPGMARNYLEPRTVDLRPRRPDLPRIGPAIHHGRRLGKGPNSGAWSTPSPTATGSPFPSS